MRNAILDILTSNSKVEKFEDEDVIHSCFDSLGWNSARFDLEDYFEISDKRFDSIWLALWNLSVKEAVDAIEEKLKHVPV